MMTAPATAETGLRRQLSLGSAVAILAGQIIAVGIFLTPAAMAKSLGSPFLLLFIWVLMALMTLCGALCFGALAAAHPKTGGIYVFLREAYGERVAFLYGWMCLLVMDPGLTAALAIGLSSYVAYLVPGLAAKLTAILVIVAIALLNSAGTGLSTAFLRWTTWLKLAVLALLPLWAIVASAGDWANLVPFLERRPGSPHLSSAIPGAFIAAFFSFGGWWEVSRIAGEVREPERNMPRALAYGTLLVAFVYIAVSFVFLYAVPLDRVASDQAFVAQMGEALFGTAGGKLLSVIVVLCVVSSMIAFMFTLPRVYVAMANDSVFPAKIAHVHPRLGTPVYAILIQAALACVLVGLGTFSQVLGYFIFSTVTFVGLAGVSAHRLSSARRLPAYPLPLVLFIAMVVLLLVMLLIGSPLQSLAGAAVVALGWPVYSAFFKRVVP